MKQDLRNLRPEVHVLICYTYDNGKAVSYEYDTPQFRAELASWFAPLGLEWIWTEVLFDNLDRVMERLVARSKERPIVVFNLCDGSEVDGYPGESVIAALSAAKLPFSGASVPFMRASTSKMLTKQLLARAGVPTAPLVRIDETERDVNRAMREIGPPIIVKPDISGGSVGIDLQSVCFDRDSTIKKIRALRNDDYFSNTDIFVEAFIRGREFSVFVVEDGDEPMGLRALTPSERLFNERLPAMERFVTYERNWHLPESNRSIPEGEEYWRLTPVEEPIRPELEALARRAFRALDGAGYARCDLRQDERTGELFVLEVNAQCSLSRDPDDATVGSMLQPSGITISDLVEMILNHALVRSRLP